jgi:phospholipase/carboxylesterase
LIAYFTISILSYSIRSIFIIIITVPDFTVPKTKFILPTASSRPISLNGGYAMPGWSDINGLDPNAAEDTVGFEESRLRIEKIMASELSNGISPSRIIIAGFSQGGALALHTVC